MISNPEHAFLSAAGVVVAAFRGSAGKSGTKYETTSDKLEKIQVFGDGKLVKRMNWLDKTARNAVFKKIKTDNMHTLAELSKKYLPFEEYRKIAPQ